MSQQLQVKVNCILVQALRPCTGRTAHRGSRGIAVPFHDHGTRRGWGVSVTPRPFFIPGKDPVPIVQEAGWAPGPVWTGAEDLAPTGIRSLERPARSQSLYRLRYRPTCHNRGQRNFNHYIFEANFMKLFRKWVSVWGVQFCDVRLDKYLWPSVVSENLSSDLMAPTSAETPRSISFFF